MSTETMGRFRARPVEVEAIWFDGTPESGTAVELWATYLGCQKAEFHPFLADHFKGDPKVYVAHPDPYVRIVALRNKVETTITAVTGEWIVFDGDEFDACKPDLFDATYESLATPTREPT
jgi:hypothetical protein